MVAEFLSTWSLCWHKSVYFVVSVGLPSSHHLIFFWRFRHISVRANKNPQDGEQTAWSGYQDKLPESRDTWQPRTQPLSWAEHTCGFKSVGSSLCFNNTVLKEAMSLLSNGPWIYSSLSPCFIEILPTALFLALHIIAYLFITSLLQKREELTRAETLSTLFILSPA